MSIKNLMPVIILSFALQASAQLSKNQYQKIDSLFIEWNKPNHPGGAIAIMQNDKTVFSKAYGLASMEYMVPNTTGTIFNIASVSKQFTAMGIVLLHQEGKLSVDDDIRKYLPELPDFGEMVTIRHMLHHTSGLRSLHAMLGLAGWRSDDSRTNTDLNRFMLNQRDLNFKPGEEYMYCNTGYMLMVNIIEKVTGEKFPAWMKKMVFEPLGMTNTYVEDNYRRIVSNNATSYYYIEGNTFERAVEYWGYVGSGNMHSTSTDLLRWLTNFHNPQPGWEAHFQMMQTLDKLNNGKENSYAFGVGLGSINGIRGIGHGGSIGGFRSNIVNYPDEELSIVVLANFSSAPTGQKSHAISKIVLGETMEEELPRASPPVKSISLSNKALAKYEGFYWNDQANSLRKIYLRNDTLRYFRSEHNESPIVPLGKDVFQMVQITEDLKVHFAITGEGKSMTVTVNEGQPGIFESFEPSPPTREELLSYTGEYYSPELETTYSSYIKNDTLFFHHSRHGDFKMKILKKDVLEGEWPLSVLKYKRDEAGQIIGVQVSNGRVRNLMFEKS
jgi:CubicO group peptidase (beta-lactamase class C family)